MRFFVNLGLGLVFYGLLVLKMLSYVTIRAQLDFK